MPPSILDSRNAYHVGFWMEHTKHSIIESTMVKGDDGVIENLEYILKLLSKDKLAKRSRGELREYINKFKRKYHRKQKLDSDDHREIISFFTTLDNAIENEMDESVSNKRKTSKASLADAKANERVYWGSQPYDVYKDILAIVENAESEVFLVDAYPSEALNDLYFSKTKRNVMIRILFKPDKDRKLITVAKKILEQLKQTVSIRYSYDAHDRLLFVDSDCYVIGQSIKDAGNKPTYIIKVNDPGKFRPPFEDLWKNGAEISSTST